MRALCFTAGGGVVVVVKEKLTGGFLFVSCVPPCYK